MATFRAVVSKYRREDGTYNVRIRVTHQRLTRYIATPFYVNQSQITRGFKIKDIAILEKVEEKIQELRKNSDSIGFLADDMSVDHLVTILQNHGDKIDFLAFWSSEIDDLHSKGLDNTALSYKTALNSVKSYNKNAPLYANIINKDYVYGYYRSLDKLSINTRRSYMRAFKTIYKHAQLKYNNDDIGRIPFKYNVFDLVHLPKASAKKDNVIRSIKEMQTIIDVPYSGTWSFDFAKDMFILSFCCLGTNMADFIEMKKSQYVDGIITYQRKKTKERLSDDSEIKIRVPEPAKIILEKYSGDPKYLIDFRGHARGANSCRRIHYTFQNAGLEEYDEKKGKSAIGHYKGKFTFYANRHSMASFARNVCKVEYMTVHEMLNHAVPSSFKTTDTYLIKDYTTIWEANDKLMALFDWSFYLKQKKEETN